MKKTIMPNPAENLRYITSYSSSSPTPIKSPSNSIKYNCKKILSWSRRPEPILKIREATFFKRSFKFLKNFLNQRKFRCRPLPKSLKCWDYRWDLSAVWKRIPSDKNQKVQAHITSELSLEYYQAHAFLTNYSWLWPF